MDHSLKQQLQQQLSKKRIPFAATIELTKKCHLNCCHCYVNHQRPGLELNLEELNDLVDQLIDLGTFIVAFSGGEVFLKNNFRELLKNTAQKNIGIKVLTSATLMRPEDVTLFKELNIMEIGISLYSATPEIHDRITGYQGSFNQSLEMMKQLLDAGITVSGRMPVMNLNQNQIKPLHKLLTNLGAIPLFDLNITSSEDHIRNSQQYGLTQKEITSLLKDEAIREILFNIDTFEELYCSPKKITYQLDEPRCGIGQTTIWIDAFGDIYPCIQYPFPVGNIKKQTLKKIWYHNPKLEKVIESSHFKHFEVCHNCSAKDHCSPCLGMALQENQKNQCSRMIHSVAMATLELSKEIDQD